MKKREVIWQNKDSLQDYSRREKEYKLTKIFGMFLCSLEKNHLQNVMRNSLLT